MRLVIPCVLAALLAVPVLPSSAAANGPPDTTITISMSGGRLGAQLQNLTGELRSVFGAPADAGVLVAGIGADSPAAKAGLRAGDVLVEIDGAKIEDPGDAIRELARKPKGANARLVVIRNKARTTLTATLRDAGGMAMGAHGQRFDFDFDGDWHQGGMKVFGDLAGMQQKIDALEGRLKDLEQKLKAIETRK